MTQKNTKISELNYEFQYLRFELFDFLEEAKYVMYMDGEDEKKEHPSCDDSNISSLDMYFHICCKGTKVT